MKSKSIISKIKSPADLKPSDEMILKPIVERYPYFQAAHALHLKLLKKEDSFDFKKYLRTSALHTTNRGILFDFINRDIKMQEFATSKIAKRDDAFENKKEQNSIGKTNDNKKQASGEISSKHSFSEWLQLTKLKPIEVKEETETNIETKTNQPDKKELVENFIKNNPKITKPEKASSTPATPLKTMPSQQMMTETLAKIYLEQKKYDKAIQAYNILILNNPKKSGFFADQIKMIQSLQENN